MTNEELIKEFIRWVNNGRGKVWYLNCDNRWELLYPAWTNLSVYITNDKHAKLRRLQIDEPYSKFEVVWDEVAKEVEPTWDIDKNYRVKAEPVYEYQWLYPVAVGRNKFALTEHRTKCDIKGYTKIEETKRIKNV